MSLVLLVALQLNSCVSQETGWINRGGDKDGYKIVCYYTNWAQYRPTPGTYFPENVDPTLCTHIIFAFAKINANYELEAFEWNDPWEEWAPGMYNRTVALKKKNPKLKVLLAVGGWNLGSLPFSNMANNEARRKNFIQKSVEFLKKIKFDGLDLDWEYPANRDTADRPDDKVFFTLLCKELSEAFKPDGLLLSAAVAAGHKYIRSAYELSEIHKYLDFINLMSYDIHGAWENTTGHNAPLYSHEFDIDKTLNLNFAVKLYLAEVPSEKIIMGLASYGRSFRITDGFDTCPITDSPIAGPGTAGKYSREAGFLGYYEICEKILSDSWTYVWNDQQKVPYAYRKENGKTEWVGFDDVESIKHKVQYIKDNNLGGAMLWALDMDDFTGTFCKQGKYPILNTVNFHLQTKANAQLPRSDALWGATSSKKKPKTEEDFLVSNSKSQKSATSPANLVDRLKSNVLEIYKFCQCKNSTHKIASSNADASNSESNNSQIIDCNLKRFQSPSSHPTDNSDYHDVLEQIKKTTKTKIDTNTQDEKKESDLNNENKNFTSIWSIFGFGNSSPESLYNNNLQTVLPILCMFHIIFTIIVF